MSARGVTGTEGAIRPLAICTSIRVDKLKQISYTREDQEPAELVMHEGKAT